MSTISYTFNIWWIFDIWLSHIWLYIRTFIRTFSFSCIQIIIKFTCFTNLIADIIHSCTGLITFFALCTFMISGFSCICACFTSFITFCAIYFSIFVMFFYEICWTSCFIFAHIKIIKITIFIFWMIITHFIYCITTFYFS